MNILFVDDEGVIIQAMLPVLKAIPDSEVRVATNAEKALDHASTWDNVDLLITDVVMEPTDGFTLRDTLQKNFPNLRTIFVSGYDLSDYPSQTEGFQILTKPVDRATFLAAVEQEAKIIKLQKTTTPNIVKPTPSPSPVKSVATSRTSTTTSLLRGDGLIGHQLGTYKIEAKIGEGKWGPVYKATQTTMGRPVAMKTLAPKFAQEPTLKERFMRNASAKANVQHPYILSVFEAGEADGLCFYTLEAVAGYNLKMMLIEGLNLTDHTALQAIKITAESLAYLRLHNVPHEHPTASTIYIGDDQHPRIANLATAENDQQSNIQHEMSAIARSVSAVLKGNRSSSEGLQRMLDKMTTTGAAGYASWEEVLEDVRALEPKVVPIDALKILERDETTRRTAERIKKNQSRSVLLGIAGVFLVAAAIIYLLWSTLLRSNEKEFNTMIEIPAGSFIYQNGKQETLPAFWIDEYEVTIGQYAKFLAYLDKHPTTQFDHPKQPKGKSHVPKDWDIYYKRAKAGKPVRTFFPINLNTPIFLVDWWDAYAYAKWKGRYLPSEQQWEKAARGTKGIKYPWGNELEPRKMNSRADYEENPSPKSEAKVDGYFKWAPVDTIQGDSSPYGVKGMAGNVNEWTGTWEKTFPILRGGSYRSDDNTTTVRFNQLDPDRAEEFIGFRTASDQPPPKPKK